MLCKVIYTCIMCDIHKWYAVVSFPNLQHSTGGLVCLQERNELDLSESVNYYRFPGFHGNTPPVHSVTVLENS